MQEDALARGACVHPDDATRVLVLVYHGSARRLSGVWLDVERGLELCQSKPSE